jgi:hypothetical protein
VFGDEYRRYRQRVAMIVPLLGGVSAMPDGPGDSTATRNTAIR